MAEEEFGFERPLGRAIGVGNTNGASAIVSMAVVGEIPSTQVRSSEYSVSVKRYCGNVDGLCQAPVLSL